MSCKQISHTPEEIKNIFMNKGILFQVGPDDTFEDILYRAKFLNDNKVLPSGENQLYRFMGYEVPHRVSTEFSKKAYESRYNKARVSKELQRPDYIRQKEVGTRMHGILAEIMNALYNKVGDMTDIRRRAALGDYAVKGEDFTPLVKLVQEQISEINKIQKTIDPNKQAAILVEQFLVDPTSNIGGALDILVVFSDKTHGRLDYKTTHSTAQNFVQGVLTDELLTLNKVADNELNMTEYGRIAQKTLGVGTTRMSRLIPIHVRLELKPEKQRGQYDIYTNNVASLNAGSASSKFLRPIPVSGEITAYAGINKLLGEEWKLINKWVEKLNKGKLSHTDRELLTKKIALKRKAIQRMILDADMSDIILSTKLILNELNNRVREDEVLSDGKPNPNYLSDEELENLTNELTTYEDIINNTHKYFGDLKTSNPELYEKLKSQISSLSSNAISVLEEAAIQRDQRIVKSISKYAGKEYVDKDGNLLPLTELPYFTRDWTRFSDIDDPIFKTAWGLFQSAFYDRRKAVINIAEDVEKIEKGVFAYAKANNIDRLEAFKLIIDTKKARLISVISQELIDKISDAYYSTDIESASKILKSIYELRDSKAFKEDYADRLLLYKETQKHKHEGGESSFAYQKDIEQWIVQNDLMNSPEAWSNTFNKKYLKIQDKVEKENYSTEYKRLLNNKPMLDYYNMYVKYNNLFREMLDITRYSELPPEFIASIRKSMVDQVFTNGLSLSALGNAGREFFESFSTREEDIDMSDVDSNGELKRTIPILFTTPFLNKDGEIDNTRMSYDLSKNLLLFAKMAYNYKYMKEIEPKIKQLKGIMATPSTNTPGMKIGAKSGKFLRGKISEFATKKGINTETYKALEDLTDMYLYGVKFKGTNKTLAKTLLKLKSMSGKQTLGLAVIPGMGALAAGEIAAFFESKKETSFTSENTWQSLNHNITNHKKYTALALFFDPYASDPLEKLIDNKSANFFSRIMTYRNLMYPLARADELMNDDILNRMAMNWGYDTENVLGKGKNTLVRLNDPTLSNEQRSKIKNIWDLTSIDEKSGKLTVKGVTDVSDEVQKRNYIAFRDAVKATSSNIIGSMSREDKSRYEGALLTEIMMQYKSWMPGIVRERTGELVFDDKIQAARWGRYKAAFAEFGLKGTDLETAFQLKQYITKVFAPNFGKLMLDLMTFGLSPRLGLVGETYTDPSGRERKVRTNIARARRMYMQYINEHPELMGKMSFEHYLEVKEGQMRAALVEMRVIITFMITISILSVGGGDDKKKPLYMANWGTRLAFKNLTKAQSELTFMWSPIQMAQLIQNPFPLTGILVKSLKTITNGLDESRDMLFGENSFNDKTPTGYFLLQWVYGAGQLARFAELYPQFMKSPYLSNTIR